MGGQVAQNVGEEAIAERLDHANMEIRQQIAARGDIVGRNRFALPRDMVAELYDGLRIDCCNCTQEARLDGAARLKSRQDFLEALRQTTLAGAGMHEAARLKADQRFTHRGARNLEQRGQGLLAQPRPRPEAPGENRIDDDAIDVSGKLVHNPAAYQTCTSV